MQEELKSGDILLTSEAPLGEVFLLSDDEYKFVLGQRLYGLRAKKDVIDSKFLYYSLTSSTVQARLQSRATGTTVLGIRQSELLKTEIDYPEDLGEQRRIAHILGALDDKIELNRQLNATLEQLARRLFQSWFVDFEPVRAKASGEPEESICRRLGLTPELLALFPAALEDSAVGEIPLGWRLNRVGNLVNTVDYVANGSFASLKENVHLFNEPNYALYLRLTDYNADFSNEMRFVDEASYNFLSKSSLDGSETIIANVGANAGTVFRAPSWLGYRMTLGSNAVALKAPKACNYVYQHFESNYGQSQLQSIITGSAQPKFNKTSLRSLPLIMPSETILHSYENLAGGIVNQQDLLKAESRTLAALRDELLPKLLSGEIRLS